MRGLQKLKQKEGVAGGVQEGDDAEAVLAGDSV